MSELIEKGSWVEIETIILPAGERAPQVPEDTQRVPLQMRVKGFLTASAALGDEVEIVTPSGRLSRGVLSVANPAYNHSFGATIPELSTIGKELRDLMSAGRKP